MNINNIDRTPQIEQTNEQKTFNFGSKQEAKRVQKIKSIISV